jgi:hypothetical protein
MIAEGLAVCLFRVVHGLHGSLLGLLSGLLSRLRGGILGGAARKSKEKSNCEGKAHGYLLPRETWLLTQALQYERPGGQPAPLTHC